MNQVKNFHIFVEGRVQGVGFRQFTHKAAKALGLKGWVRNLMDGRVEIKVTGSETQLTPFFEALRQGPAFSKVKEVKKLQIELELDRAFEVISDESV